MSATSDIVEAMLAGTVSVIAAIHAEREAALFVAEVALLQGGFMGSKAGGYRSERAIVQLAAALKKSWGRE